MAEACTCGGRLGNTGIDNCVIEFRATNNYILMPTYKGDASKNYIDISTPLTLGATVLALTQATTTALERLYPLPFIDDYDRTKGDPVVQTTASGNVYFVKDGIRKNEMTFVGKNASFSFIRELSLFNCTSMSYFPVDIAGTMEGYVDDDFPTRFYPFPMMKNSFYEMYNYATNTELQSLKLSFNLQQNFDENQIYYLTKGDFGYPATELVGLIPVTITVSAITATGATFTVQRPNQGAIGSNPFTGLIPGDFTVTDVTGAANVPVLTAPETAVGSGVYVATWADVPGANDFTVTAASAGYAFGTTEFSDPS